MFTRILPPVVLEFLLAVVLIMTVLFLLRIVLRARRKRIAEGFSTLSDADAALLSADVPQLSTPYRVSAPIVRLTPAVVAPSPPLVELRYGKKPLVFTPTDFASSTARERYQAATGKDAGDSDVALFALCTLDIGGADAMQSQIKDYDKIVEPATAVRLIPSPTQAGDYVIIAHVLSHRRDQVAEGLPVVVYRAEVIKNAELHLVIELAVLDDEPSPDPNNEPRVPFADGAMVHGSARMYGYLP